MCFTHSSGYGYRGRHPRSTAARSSPNRPEPLGFGYRDGVAGRNRGWAGGLVLGYQAKRFVHVFTDLRSP